ncbi:MAG: RHS repeat-associated core domain-containing protein, partial [Candidatus Helarchaeota archaeon]
PTWYLYAGDDRIATIDENGNLYYYLKDHLGTTRMTIRDNGTVYGRYYRYYAFGETESEQITLNQDYKYTGKPFDSELGLDIYYYGARYYNPHLGRWLAVDPLHDKYPSLSPYVYCSDNPMKYVDPDGNWVYVPSGNGLTGTAIEMSRSGELGNIMQSMIFQLDIHSGQSFNIMVDNKFVKQDDS